MDTVSVDEIKFGDNDSLGARWWQAMVKADLYIILTGASVEPVLLTLEEGTERSTIFVQQVIRFEAL